MSELLPRAVLLDLDDTILDDTGNVEECWHRACHTHCVEKSDIDPDILIQAIDKTRDWFWSDGERHRVGRLDLAAARRQIVNLSLVELGIDDAMLAAKIADTYHLEREGGVRLFPDALDTVRWLREKGCLLGLLTNGNAHAQRSKISRFGLDLFFDLILIEGEVGFGKPDSRIYERALNGLGVESSEAWMVGDNLEWDVLQPQRLGIFGIWIDARGQGLPSGIDERPNKVIQRLSEMRQLL